MFFEVIELFPSQHPWVANVWVLRSSGYAKLPFKWFDYLREMASVAAPVKLFNKVRVILSLLSSIIYSSSSIQLSLSSSKEESSPPSPHSPFRLLFPPPHAGGAQSRFPTGHEAWGRRPHGASSGVCCYGNEDCAPATENPLWRLGRRVRPVGGLWVSRPLPCGLVSADGLPAPTSSITE